MDDYRLKIERFATIVEMNTIGRLREQVLDCDANIKNATASIRPGKVYDKVDQGSSGRFMVEVRTGNIYGIKAYGKVHKGRHYGTLDTVDDWFWGDYTPRPIRV